MNKKLRCVLVVFMAAIMTFSAVACSSPAATEAKTEEPGNVVINDSTAVQEKVEVDLNKEYKDTIVISYQGVYIVN